MNVVEVVRQFWANSSAAAKIAVVAAPVIVILMIVMAVIMNKPATVDEPRVEITGFTKSAPADYEQIAKNLIWGIINNTQYVPDDVEDYGAVVREGSYYEYKNGDVVNGSMLIDIPELRYSFKVNMHWGESRSGSTEASEYDETPVKIECPYYTDVIYPETGCVLGEPIDQIERYTPYNFYLESGERVQVKRENLALGPKLMIYVRACKNQSVLDAAKSGVENWLKTMYFNPGDFEMEMYDTCK